MKNKKVDILIGEKRKSTSYRYEYLYITDNQNTAFAIARDNTTEGCCEKACLLWYNMDKFTLVAHFMLYVERISLGKYRCSTSICQNKIR